MINISVNLYEKLTKIGFAFILFSSHFDSTPLFLRNEKYEIKRNLHRGNLFIQCPVGIYPLRYLLKQLRYYNNSVFL